MKHCRVSCAMGSSSPNVADDLGDLNEFIDAFGAELGLGSVVDWRDFYNNDVGIGCASKVKAGTFKDCAECCKCSNLK